MVKNVSYGLHSIVVSSIMNLAFGVIEFGDFGVFIHRVFFSSLIFVCSAHVNGAKILERDSTKELKVFEGRGKQNQLGRHHMPNLSGFPS